MYWPLLPARSQAPLELKVITRRQGMEHDSRSLVRHFSTKRVHDSEWERIIDTVAAEEPLEIRVQYRLKEALKTESLAVTMRTPGADLELVAGLLVAEGVVRSRRDLAELRQLGSEPSNEVLASLAQHVDFESWRLSRATFVSGACGVCGKRTREAISAKMPESRNSQLTVPRSLIESLPRQLRDRQVGFTKTGGFHGAAAITENGRVEAVFEDIGRHNALDKLIGWCLLNDRFPLHRHILFLSSRSSFELIQKALMACAPVLATVGGPSSLAIETAREHGITLIGFVRDGRFNVYSGDWRVAI